MALVANKHQRKKIVHQTDWSKLTHMICVIPSLLFMWFCHINSPYFIYIWIHSYTHRHLHIQPHTWAGFSRDVECFALFPFLFFRQRKCHITVRSTQILAWNVRIRGRWEKYWRDHTSIHTQVVCEWWHWKKWHFLCKMFRTYTHTQPHRFNDSCSFGGSNILLWLAFKHLKDENMASSIQNC